MVPGNSLASCGNTILRSKPLTQTDSQQAPEPPVRLSGTQFINPAAWAGDAAGKRSATAARVSAAIIWKRVVFFISLSFIGPLLARSSRARELVPSSRWVDL